MADMTPGSGQLQLAQSTVTLDRAGKDHWERMWESEEFPADIDLRSQSVWAHRDQLFHEVFRNVLAGRSAGSNLLELGCARSAWLPYFAREFGFQVAGLDYSELGATQAAERLRAAGISGDIRCADLFDPPADWRDGFDVVAWFGVAEHFQDTTAAIRAAARCLKPGGLLITEIPNMSGVIGWVQRWANKPVYDIHVPLTAPQLAARHAAAGLEVVASSYVVPADFGIVDPEGIPPGVSRSIKKRILYALRLLAGVIWWVDKRVGVWRPGWLTAGFVIVCAEKRRPSQRSE
jgi:SAM-dependent methyltransferase